jgi:hypothetical protein
VRDGSYIQRAILRAPWQCDPFDPQAARGWFPVSRVDPERPLTIGNRPTASPAESACSHRVVTGVVTTSTGSGHNP